MDGRVERDQWGLLQEIGEVGGKPVAVADQAPFAVGP